MQQKTAAESEDCLTAFCRPVNSTDSSTPTFIHLFTLCFQLWFLSMAHALGHVSPGHPQNSRMACYLFHNAANVFKGENSC